MNLEKIFVCAFIWRIEEINYLQNKNWVRYATGGGGGG